MIAGKIAGEVAEGLAKKAVPTVAKTAKKVATAVDDWGWKGGKPGEVSGTQYYRTLNAVNSGKAPKEELNNLLDSAWVQFDKGASKGRLGRDRLPVTSNPVERRADAELLLEDFYSMEKAGVPRSLTGKLIKSLPKMQAHPVYKKMLDFHGGMGKRDLTLNDYAKAFGGTYSDLVKGLSKSQRETFFSLLPEWKGSLDDLAKAARDL
jgi:hypothetical protein